MSPELKDAIISFLRALVSAGVGYVLVYIAGVNLLQVGTAELTHGVTMAFITGVLIFLGNWARNATTQPAATSQPAQAAPSAERRALAGPHLNRTRSWADALPI